MLAGRTSTATKIAEGIKNITHGDRKSFDGQYERLARASGAMDAIDGGDNGGAVGDRKIPDSVLALSASLVTDGRPGLASRDLACTHPFSNYATDRRPCQRTLKKKPAIASITKPMLAGSGIGVPSSANRFTASISG